MTVIKMKERTERKVRRQLTQSSAYLSFGQCLLLSRLLYVFLLLCVRVCFDCVVFGVFPFGSHSNYQTIMTRSGIRLWPTAGVTTLVVVSALLMWSALSVVATADVGAATGSAAAAFAAGDASNRPPAPAAPAAAAAAAKAKAPPQPPQPARKPAARPAAQKPAKPAATKPAAAKTAAAKAKGKPAAKRAAPARRARRPAPAAPAPAAGDVWEDDAAATVGSNQQKAGWS